MPDSHYERNNGPEDCEIEITPEMIEAGMHEYNGRWLGLVEADDNAAREMLREAFKAMYRILRR